MWENETVVLATSLRKRLLGDASSVRFGKISSDTGIPVFIQVQFQNRVEKYLKEESPLTLQNTPHFQFREEELALLRGRFMDAFRETATFDVKEIDQILQEALTVKLDYLVKPSATMRKLLFNGITSVSVKALEDVLSPFTKVLPYAETLVKTCRNHQLSALEQDNYGNMMENVFQEIFSGNPIQAVLSDYASLHEFLSETKGETVLKSEGNLLLDFFSDRNLWGFRRAVEVEMKLGRADFDATALEMTLKRYEEFKQDFPVASSSVQVEKATVEKKEESKALDFDLEPEPKEVKPEVKPEPEQKEEDDIKSVLNDIMKEKSADVKTSEAEVTVKKENTEDKDDLEAEGVWDLEDVLGEDELGPIGKKESPEIEKKTEQAKPKGMGLVRRDQEEEESDVVDVKPSKGLRSFITDKTEKGFIKKLFGGDEAAYDELIDKLDEAESWRVAKILIDNELFKRDVDPFSREAIRLVDMVYSRYYPEEGIGGT